MYVCMYICMYVYIYIYIYIFFAAVIVLMCNYFPKLLKTYFKFILQIFGCEIIMTAKYLQNKQKNVFIILENNCTLVQFWVDDEIGLAVQGSL